MNKITSFGRYWDTSKIQGFIKKILHHLLVTHHARFGSFQPSPNNNKKNLWVSPGSLWSGITYNLRQFCNSIPNLKRFFEASNCQVRSTSCDEKWCLSGKKKWCLRKLTLANFVKNVQEKVERFFLFDFLILWTTSWQSITWTLPPNKVAPFKGSLQPPPDTTTTRSMLQKYMVWFIGYLLKMMVCRIFCQSIGISTIVTNPPSHLCTQFRALGRLEACYTWLDFKRLLGMTLSKISNKNTI